MYSYDSASYSQVFLVPARMRQRMLFVICTSAHRSVHFVLMKPMSVLTLKHKLLFKCCVVDVPGKTTICPNSLYKKLIHLLKFGSNQKCGLGSYTLTACFLTGFSSSFSFLQLHELHSFREVKCFPMLIFNFFLISLFCRRD